MAEPKSTSPLIAGFLGGSVSTTLLFPLDIIKVRLQVHQGGKTLGALRVVGLLYKYEGLGGFFAGWTPAVIGSAVSWGGYFFFYEKFKKLLVQSRSGNSSMNPTSHEMALLLTPADNFVLAVAAGGIMVGFTNPVWLVKTRMQLQMKRSSQIHNIQPYTGVRDAFRTIVREEGFWTLYRGSGPALLLTSHGGVQFVVYEFLKKHFHFRRAKREETNNVWERFELSMGYLSMGAFAKM